MSQDVPLRGSTPSDLWRVSSSLSESYPTSHGVVSHPNVEVEVHSAWTKFSVVGNRAVQAQGSKWDASKLESSERMPAKVPQQCGPGPAAPSQDYLLR